MSQSAHEYGFATRGANVRATMHAGTREVHSAREGKGGAERCSADSDDKASADQYLVTAGTVARRAKVWALGATVLLAPFLATLSLR